MITVHNTFAGLQLLQGLEDLAVHGRSDPGKFNDFSIFRDIVTRNFVVFVPAVSTNLVRMERQARREATPALPGTFAPGIDA
jgi:hypothetical protein